MSQKQDNRASWKELLIATEIIKVSLWWVAKGDAQEWIFWSFPVWSLALYRKFELSIRLYISNKASEKSSFIVDCWLKVSQHFCDESHVSFETLHS